MWLIEQALERIVGLSPAMMRPPYGNYNDLVRQVAAERNQSRAFLYLSALITKISGFHKNGC